MKRTKQINLFGRLFAPTDDGKYTSKIEAPIYEPKNLQPRIQELYSKEKTRKLLNEIEKSNVSAVEKKFLITAAERHTVFNYERIADYYSHASEEMQDLMEKSALVIIDFDKAIEYGYVQLCDKLRKQFMEDYGEEKDVREDQ